MKKIDASRLPLCVAIVGSRSFADGDTKWVQTEVSRRMDNMVSRFVFGLDERTEIVSGGARGVDRYAERAAEARGMRMTIYYPDESLGWPKAAAVRNREIVQHIDQCDGVIIAFKNVKKSSGTDMTVDMANKIGVPVIELFFTPDAYYNGFLRGPERFLK